MKGVFFADMRQGNAHDTFLVTKGLIQMGMLTKRLEKSFDLMTTNRISIGKMALEFLHYFSFNTNLLANI